MVEVQNSDLRRIRMFIGAAAERLTISVDFELSSWG